MVKISVLSFFVYFIIGCHPTENSKSILDSFKAVDARLDSVSVQGQNETLGAFVEKTSTDSTLMDADNDQKKIAHFIAAAKALLQNQHEDDSVFVNQYFLTQRKGEQLFSLMKAYQQKVLAISLDDATKNNIDSIFSRFLDVPVSKSWSDSYFRNTTSVAALTMLNYFELNIRKVFILLKNGRN